MGCYMVCERVCKLSYILCNSGVQRMPHLPLPEELRDNPRLFLKLMEEYGIGPSDLHISRVYKNMMKKGERKPSLQLCKKLLQVIKQRLEVQSERNGVSGGPIPAWGGCEASRTSRPTPTWPA